MCFPIARGLLKQYESRAHEEHHVDRQLRGSNMPADRGQCRDDYVESVTRQRLVEILTKLFTVYQQSEVALLGTKTRGLERLNVRGVRNDISLDDDLVSMRRETQSMLVSWASLIVDERETADRPGRSVRELICHLRANVDWLSHHPAAQDAIDELRAMCDRAEQIVHGTSENSRIIELGRCEEPGCRGVVTVARLVSTEVPTPSATCEFGHRAPPHRWLIVADTMRRGA